MASEKKVILFFTDCEGKALLNSNNETMKKIIEKGVILSKVKGGKQEASCGNQEGQSLWEAAANEKLIVGTLDEAFDLAIIDAGNTLQSVEPLLNTAMEKVGRTSLLVIVAKGLVAYYGINVAKGKLIEEEICACTVAPTIAYIANFPIPINNKAHICYEVFKDLNFKFKEVQKLQQAMINMEAAIERSTRQPWDKHDCA